MGTEGLDVGGGQKREHVKDHVLSLVASGALRRGSRLPSILELSRDLGVAKNTVIGALDALCGEGVLEARERTGFFVRVARRRSPALATRLADLETDRVAHGMATILVPAGGDLVTIGGGTSSETLLATPAWTAALRNAPPRDPLEALRYADPLGEPHLREVIAARFAPSDDAAGRVIVTHGAVESLNLCFASAAAATGSRRVALESPGYFMLGPILNHLGLDPVPISRTRKGLDLEQLGRELKRAPIAALMLNTNHQNPVGTSLSLAERFEIAKLADERRFFVVEDDVYKGLGVSDETGPLSRPVDGDDPPSIASFVPERTAYVGSFSKSLGPALRVGFTIAPPSLFADLRRRKFLQSLAGDAYTQNLVADFVDKRGYQKHLLEMREELGRRARIARAQAEPFERLGRFTTPYAGGLFWLFEFGHGLDAMDLYRRARQRNLLVSPGCYFRPVEDTSAVDDRWMRVNVSRCEGTTLSHALKVLSELAQSSG